MRSIIFGLICLSIFSCKSHVPVSKDKLEQSVDVPDVVQTVNDAGSPDDVVLEEVWVQTEPTVIVARLGDQADVCSEAEVPVLVCTDVVETQCLK